MNDDPNEEKTCEPNPPASQPANWGTSSISFNIQDDDNADKLAMMIDAGF